MPKKLFYGEKICSILIQMGSEGVTERVAGQLLLPSQFFFVGMNMPAEIEGIYGSVRTILFGEEIASGLSSFIPILGENVQRLLSKDGIAVRPVL